MNHPLGHPCDDCRKRGHPLDLIAQLSPEYKAEQAALADRIRAMPYVELRGHSLPDDNRAGMGAKS